MDDFDLGPFKPPPASTSASHYDDMFDSYFNRSAEVPEPSPSSPPPGHLPVFDKPVFDGDPDVVNPFGAIPLFGVGGVEGKDFLDSPGKSMKPEREPESEGVDEDLIPELGGSTRLTTPVTEAGQNPWAVGFDDYLIPEISRSTKPMKAAPLAEPEVMGFDDDVISRFGESTSQQDSTREESRTRQGKESISSSKTSVSMQGDPFVILGATSNLGYSSFGLFTDHLDNLGMPTKSESAKFDAPSTTSGMLESHDIIGGVPKPIPSFSFPPANMSDFGQNRPLDGINTLSHSNLMPQEKPVQRDSAETIGTIFPEMHFTEASDIHETPGTTGFQIGRLARNTWEQLQEENPEEKRYSKMPNDVWLTVSDIVLVTQPTNAPPPSRPPPPLATKQPPAESTTSKTYPQHHNPSYHPSLGLGNSSKAPQIDEQEDFVMAKPAEFANGQDWVEGRHSKGVDKGESDSIFTSSQYQEDEINKKSEFYAYKMGNRDAEERLEHEQKQRENEEEEQRSLERMREEDLEREREKVRKREQEERKRHEKEKEARQAVEKAIQEARERAAAGARMQAEKEAHQRAEQAAVRKVAEEARARAAADAREKAAKVAAEAKERAAVEARERAAAEARERTAKAAAEARERAIRVDTESKEKIVAESQAKAAAEARSKAERAAVEKATAEARRRAERAAVEKAAAEARRRAERAAVERATAEARQRAANEARERAAAEARAKENQQRTAQPDLDSFFGVPSRSGTVPRTQTTTTNPFDVQPQGSADFGAARNSSSGSASPFTQPPSSNLINDLSSIFGAPSSSAVFQEVDGESEERRKARLERHQRTMERAAKAVAEKNERDLQVQWEQEERHRIGGTLDFEIKRWAAGKEGNLRALLSTLQYILWPECRWQPISLTDLIAAASVKKVYRKATLCIHPDKVQQKGANLQQKYIAEKVFDLLKEAWNKFNSEELF